MSFFKKAGQEKSDTCFQIFWSQTPFKVFKTSYISHGIGGRQHKEFSLKIWIRQNIYMIKLH